MDRSEFMKVPLKHFPANIKKRYNLNSLIKPTEHVFIKIKKDMYGLKQAAILAYNNLIFNLKQDGYFPILHTDSYWQHEKYPTIFCLCVDNFGVKYFHKMILII